MTPRTSNRADFARTARFGRAPLLGLAAPLLLAGGCDRQAPDGDRAGAAARLVAFVSIPPQAWLLQRIAGEHVDVEVLVGPGQSPHTFTPTPRQVSRLARARLFFSIGVPFERALLDKIRSGSNGLEIVDTRAGIELRTLDEQGDPHEQEHEHASETGQPDPHVWLDPKRAAILAQNMADALARLEPAHAHVYRTNLAALQADLQRLDARIAARLEPFRGRAILVFHPAYGYFADAYGLRQVAIQVGGKNPHGRALGETVRWARENDVRVVFYEPQFDAARARVVAEEIGGVAVPLDPLARDYADNLRRVSEQVQAALEQRAP